MEFTIPIKLPSLANTRMHWRAMSNIKKKQKKITTQCMQKCMETQEIPSLPLVVLIIRVGPTVLDDDNLASACKYVRDAIAKEIGVDDGSPLYSWRYGQVKGDYCVRIYISSR